MIGDIVKVTVDRPMGSYHPKHKDILYPINYGYIEGIMAPDGEEQDAYILGVDKPVSEFTGKIILPWGENIIVGVIGAVVMTSASYIIVKLLAREARRCANTQIREVIVAYYHFVENKENVPLNTETDSNREQETNKNMCLVILDKFRNAVKKLFE